MQLKVTTIILVMRHCFPHEILKQLDMDYKPSLTWLQKFRTLHPKRWNKLLLWMNSKPKPKYGSQKTVNVDSVEDLQLFKKETLAQAFSCKFWDISKNTFSHRIPSVTVSASGSLKGNINALTIYITNKLTLRKTEWFDEMFFVVAVMFILLILLLLYIYTNQFP